METLIISGNVGPRVELRRTQNGDPVLNFSVAVDQGKDTQGNKRDAKWFECALWGKRAEALERYITKGSKVTVSGRPTAREHNGKAYLGCNVQEITLMGGGERREEAGGHSDTAGGYGGGGRPGDDLDGEIPFAPEVRI